MILSLCFTASLRSVQASEVEMVDMRSHAKSKSLPQKGINGIVEIMCHYDVLASLNVFDGEKCLTQALKLLCPLSSHPFARGIGVAYLLLLETHDLHGLIKLPQKLVSCAVVLLLAAVSISHHLVCCWKGNGSVSVKFRAAIRASPEV